MWSDFPQVHRPVNLSTGVLPRRERDAPGREACQRDRHHRGRPEAGRLRQRPQRRRPHCQRGETATSGVTGILNYRGRRSEKYVLACDRRGAWCEAFGLFLAL